MPNETREAKRAKLRKDHPDTWIPCDEGDEIIGTVTDIVAAFSEVQEQGRGDGWYPLLTVEATQATGYKPGTLKVHGMPAVLQSEILRTEPRPGEEIRIVYNGTGEAKVRGRNAPELFRLTVTGRDPKEVADRVYASMRHKVRRPTTTVPPEDTDSGSAAADGADTDEVVPF